ncbi:MAG: alkaline phosphatase D family protein [Saprospiraceae bacterium]|nr:alkaline phosphatase D family protein [Saprospiraceae bacterium]
MSKSFYNIVFILFIISTGMGSVVSQKNLLKSGPMLGPVTLRDVTLWVQTTTDASVYFTYRVKGSKNKYVKSETVQALKNDAYTVQIHISGLTPGTTYEYKTNINDKEVSRPYTTEFTTQSQWQYRTDPPDFTFIAGSCFYINDTSYDRPGNPYGGDYNVVNEMYKSRPDLMVWLGDNIYLREGDFESRSGIYYRHTHTRSLPELQPFLSSIPQYAIWDDHDYGSNDSDWTYPLKNHSLDAFKDFWPSETYGAGGTDGVTNSFVWNDCQFFMLDDRWYRTANLNYGSILGEVQKYWLKETLLSSRATFKFIAVGGQFLSDFAGFENFANYKAEREEIINFLDENNIKGVVFLTGDRHHSEITKLKTKKGNVFYDVTSSAITSTTYDHSNEINSLRVKGSMVSERNFGVFSVKGNQDKRSLAVTFKNVTGKEVYQYDFEF